MSWINVKEKIPKNSEGVIFCTNEYYPKMYLGYFLSPANRWIGMKYLSDYTEADDPPANFSQGEITYWMPLPKLPNND